MAQEFLAELGVEARIGVNTGEVVTGTEERLATGDAVNVAARLQQAAEPGEILIGPDTRRLVRDAVTVGDERLLELRGKAEPLTTYRLAGVREAPERRHDTAFVGRTKERPRASSARLSPSSSATSPDRRRSASRPTPRRCVPCSPGISRV